MQGTWENGKYILASTKDERIAKLETENQRLREALEKIANHRTISDTGTEYGFFDLKDIAKQAIAEVDK